MQLASNSEELRSPSFLDQEAIIQKINSVPVWYHRVEIAHGIVTPGVNDTAACLQRLNLPDDCRGLRVLDIGARDGFYSFECERRGAEVVAIDYVSPDETGFSVLAEIFGSKLVCLHENVYNLSKRCHGEFDIVLFMGVLYHLRNPMAALDVIRDVCRGNLYLESYVIDDRFQLPDGTLLPLRSVSETLLETPIMQYYFRDSLNKDPSNYWAPNVKCMELMLRETNFEILEKAAYGGRAMFKCAATLDPAVEDERDVARAIVPFKQ